MGDHWKFNKEVSVGDLIAVAIAIGTVFAAYFNLSAEIELLRSRVAMQEQVNDNLKSDIYMRLNRIEDKLDRLVERK